MLYSRIEAQEKDVKTIKALAMSKDEKKYYKRRKLLVEGVPRAKRVESAAQKVAVAKGRQLSIRTRNLQVRKFSDGRLRLKRPFLCEKCPNIVVRKEHLSCHLQRLHSTKNFGGSTSKTVGPRLKSRRRAAIMKRRSDCITCVSFRKGEQQLR